MSERRIIIYKNVLKGAGSACADKYTRAIPAAMKYEAGMVYHLEGADWLNVLETELLEFPNGTYDDQVDVISYAVYIQSWGYLNAKKRGSRALVLG